MKTFLLVILSIALPAVAIALHEGFNKHFWICLILWVLAFTWPVASIYALIRVLNT